MASRGLGIAVQADADADTEAPENVKDGRAKQGSVGLDADVHLGRHLSMQHPGQPGQPFRTGQQRLTAVQDDLYAGQIMLPGMLADALDHLVAMSSAIRLG